MADEFVIPDSVKRRASGGEGEFVIPETVTRRAAEYAPPPEEPKKPSLMARGLASLARMTRPSGQLEAGNIDLNKRPRVRNEDGSISTVRSLGVNVDGREVLIPTVSDDGRILTDDEAVAVYRRTGKHLGVFETPQASDKYAEQLHLDQERQYGERRGVLRNGASPYVATPEAGAQAARRAFAAEDPRRTGAVVPETPTILDRPAPPGMVPGVPPGLTEQEMLEGSNSPARLEQLQQAQLASQSRANAPSARPFDLSQNIAQDIREGTSNPIARGAVAGFSELGKAGVGAVRGVADATGMDRVADFAGGAARSAETIGGGMTRGLAGNDKLIADVTASIATSAPSIALGTIGGPALRTLFAQTAAAEYNAGRDAGFSPADSAARAGIMGAAEALGERFGFGEQIRLLKGMVGKMPAGDMAKMFGAMIRKEVPGEQLTTAMQFLADKMGPAGLHPNATVDDYLNAAGETLKVTIAQTAVMGGGPAAVATGREQLQRADAAIGRSAGSQAEKTAKDAGFLRPTEQRKQAFDQLDDVAALHGLPSKAVQAAKDQAERLPLAEVPGFFERFVRALGKRMGRPIGDAPPAVPRETMPNEGTTVPNSGTNAAETATPISADELLGTVDETAHDAATSPLNDHPEPTDAQKLAGNYRVGRTRVAGLDISIENPEGSTRRGVDPDGNPWETTMRSHYGYIRGTTAPDGDKLDVFIKPGTKGDFTGPVWVVDQIDPKTGKFDEAKVMLGFASQQEAEQGYRANYAQDWQGFGAITQLPMPAFKAWAQSKETRRPLGDLTSTDGARSSEQGLTAAAAEFQPEQPASNRTDAGGMVPAGPRESIEPDAAPASAATQGEGNESQEGRQGQGRRQGLLKPKASNPLAAISYAGGISPSLIADLSRKVQRTRTNKKTGKQTPYTTWHNPLAGGKGALFRNGGTSDLNEIARILQEAGFLEQGLVERDYGEANRRVQDILHAALNDQQVTPEADPEAIDDEMRRRAEMAMDRDDTYPELDDEAAREAEAERQAIMAENDIRPSDIPYVPDEQVEAIAYDDEATALRAMGFTEDEIRERTQVQAAAPEPAQGREEEPASRAPPDEAGSAAARTDQERLNDDARATAESGNGKRRAANPRLADEKDAQRADEDGGGKLRHADDDRPKEQKRAAPVDSERSDLKDTYAGRHKRGMAQHVAEVERKRLQRQQPELDWRTEPAEGKQYDAERYVVNGYEKPTLEAQTLTDLQAKAERETAATKADTAEQKRLADKARADAERGEFTLTGSDRPADVAAAAGQGDIFGADTKPRQEPTTAEVSTQAPADTDQKQAKPDRATIELKKRIAVLERLRECLTA